MATAQRTKPKGQLTYRTAELELGAIYRDALSGYLVLVREVAVKTYVPGGTLAEERRLVGWYYNPTLGRHQEMELHDHQLLNAETLTELKCDSRYDPRP
jgi:hypothetical protein